MIKGVRLDRWVFMAGMIWMGSGIITAVRGIMLHGLISTPAVVGLIMVGACLIAVGASLSALAMSRAEYLANNGNGDVS